MWGKRTHRRWIGWLLLALLAGGLWLGRERLLTGLAWAWVVDEGPGPADAVLVLGGGLQSRPFAVAALYAAGYAPAVVVIRNAPRRTDKMGVTVDDTTATVAVLKAMGVPEKAIRVTDRPAFSTRDEAEMVRELAEAEGWSAVLAPTDVFHTRRVRWTLARALRGTGCGVRVVAVEPPGYGVADWWRAEEGLLAFQNEVVKLAYYWLAGNGVPAEAQRRGEEGNISPTPLRENTSVAEEKSVPAEARRR